MIDPKYNPDQLSDDGFSEQLRLNPTFRHKVKCILAVEDGIPIPTEIDTTAYDDAGHDRWVEASQEEEMERDQEEQQHRRRCRHHGYPETMSPSELAARHYAWFLSEQILSARRLDKFDMELGGGGDEAIELIDLETLYCGDMIPYQFVEPEIDISGYELFDLEPALDSIGITVLAPDIDLSQWANIDLQTVADHVIAKHSRSPKALPMGLDLDLLIEALPENVRRLLDGLL